MTKLELTVKVLLNQMDAATDDRETILKTGLKSFAADLLNLSCYLKGKGVDEEAARDIMEQQGVDLNLKTKKFS